MEVLKFIVRWLRSSYNFDALCCESCKAFFRRNGERLQVFYYQCLFFFHNYCPLNLFPV